MAYIDQLHHKLLQQIHSDGIPPQLIKGDFAIFYYVQALWPENSKFCPIINLAFKISNYESKTLK